VRSGAQISASALILWQRGIPPAGQTTGFSRRPLIRHTIIYTDMSSSPRESDRAVELVEHFASRLFLVYSCFFYSIEFKKERSLLNEPGMSWRGLFVLPTIHDACLNTTLMAMRDLDDFFTPRTPDSRKDDLKASDLGFNECLSFLGKSERQSINKLVMHSTTVAVNGKQNVPWDIEELTSKCVSQSLLFLNWMEASYNTEKHQKVRAAAIFYKMQINLILEKAKKINGGNMG
jgi:hypothetical protein